MRHLSGRFDLAERNAAYNDPVAALVRRAHRAVLEQRLRQARSLVWAAYTERRPQLPLIFATERVLAVPELRGWDRRVNAHFGSDVERWYFAR